MIKTLLKPTTRAHYAWILLFGLALQGLMPPGYMPDFSRHQLFAITICTGTGRMQIMAPLGPQHHQHPQDNTPCAYGVNPLASFGGLPNILLFLLVLSFSAALVTLSDFKLLRMRIYGNASSRAPPIFS